MVNKFDPLDLLHAIYIDIHDLIARLDRVTQTKPLTILHGDWRIGDGKISHVLSQLELRVKIFVRQLQIDSEISMGAAIMNPFACAKTRNATSVGFKNYFQVKTACQVCIVR